MKRMICLLGLMVVLTGCSQEDRELAAAMKIRDELLSAGGCSFHAEVTADYGDSLNSFSMDCRGDSSGNLNFEITDPQSIAGIKGSISEQGGNISFDGQALYFPLLTDDQLTPASAPWIFLKTMRSGCITAVCREEGLLHVTVDDSYEEDPLTLDIWFQEEEIPIRADVLYDGKRILTIDVENFLFS